MLSFSGRMRWVKAAVKNFVIGATVYEMIEDLREKTQYAEYLLMLAVFGDMLGYPVPPYYKLRLLSVCIPKLDPWKKAMLRERDITGRMGQG